MQRRRVVITGLGVITSLGESADEMWENVCAGKSGISSIRRWDTTKYPVKIGGELYSDAMGKSGERPGYAVSDLLCGIRYAVRSPA